MKTSSVAAVNVQLPCASLRVQSLGRFLLKSLHERCVVHARVWKTQTAEKDGEDANADADSDAFDVEDVQRHALFYDPTKWKEQDHYRLLGLGKKRWNATDADIKRACMLHTMKAAVIPVLDRRMVLKYHPDKQQSQSRPMDDDFFKCVQKAYEILSDPNKRRLYDSIDAQFDDGIPIQTTDPAVFYAEFGSAFERNAHFSKKTPVPLLGDDQQPRKTVESFYRFWTQFESWRSFDWQLELPEEAENRDERRYLEKQNKAELSQLKKEEMARLARLVDRAYKSDPRLARWKEEERLEKERIKEKKRLEQQKLEEEKRKQEEEARLEKERLAEQQRLETERERAQREQLKKQVKMQRKAIRAVVAERFTKDAHDLTQKAESFFSLVGTELDALERLLARLSVCDQVEEAKAVIQSVFDQYKKPEQTAPPTERQPVADEAPTAEQLRPWSVEEVKLLTKAVNMFPGGTGNRWQTIAEYISQHANLPERNVKEVMEQVKTIRSNARSIASTLQASNQETATPTADTPAAPRPWTAQEQSMLEKALRKYPASKFSGADRWDRVASEVEGRNRSEVLKRIKELAALTKKTSK